MSHATNDDSAGAISCDIMQDMVILPCVRSTPMPWTQVRLRKPAHGYRISPARLHVHLSFFAIRPSCNRRHTLRCPCNPGSKPSLMTFREVETLFHEFGHALQHMLTEVREGMASGIRCARVGGRRVSQRTCVLSPRSDAGCCNAC